VESLEDAVERYHLAAGEFVTGNVEPYTAMFTERDDITIANPFGPVRHGQRDAIATIERAASLWRDGQVEGFERIATFATKELACIVEVERFRARIGGSEQIAPVALRTTSVLRLEEDRWKVVHRHADSITGERPPESVIQA
jgi:ketosteroid isomerase-like protein